MGGDGQVAGTVPAQTWGTHKNETLVAEPSDCLTPWDGQAVRIYSQDGTFPTLQARPGQAGQNSQSVLVGASEPIAVDYKQTTKTSDNICHTLTREGDGGIHSAVAYGDPVVMASAHYNAEIGEGGGRADPHSAHRQGRACTSNGDDVFPSLCATDGDKQFIDNQSVRSGRLVLQRRDSDGGRQRQDGGGRGDVRLPEGGGAHDCVASNGDDVIGALCARDHKGVGSQYVDEGKVILSWESR